MLDTLQELFEHELRDMYDAENKLVRALDTMAKKVGDETLSQAFKEHRQMTQGQVKRLEKVFRFVDKKPRREPCRGINGLIEEFTKFVSQEEPSKEILNAFAIGAALKVEHYEIVAYQSLLRLAGRSGLTEAIGLLEQSLAEEQDTAQRLESMADQFAGLSTPAYGSAEEPVVMADVDLGEEVMLLDDSEAAGLRQSVAQPEQP